MGHVVAVVEDEPLTRELLGDLLRSRDYTVLPFAELEEALEALSGRPPDLLVTDVGLPDGSGLELIARLRSHLGAGAVPVLVVSGLASESDILRAYAAGADDFLAKPFSSDELLAKCAVLVAKGARRSPPAALLGSGSPLFNGRYRRQSVLGQGAYGSVYLAEDVETGGQVALKLLRDGVSEENRHRFLRESYVLSGVQHPHVVRLLDFGLAAETLYCAMERVEGVSLYERCLLHGALSEPELISLLEPLASALAALHARKLVHRDLKPQNVMLRERRLSEPVLIDFGLAKLETDRSVTDPRIVMGTPGYIPPELFLPGGEFTTQGDLYSLGMLARFCLEGELWPSLEHLEVMDRLLASGAPIPLVKSAGLRQILTGLLENDPARRFATADAVVAALRQLDPPEHTAAPPPAGAEPSHAYRTTKIAPRRPRAHDDRDDHGGEPTR